ncbi:MAG: L-seryl-tRNA(Sec) selenium transferase [Clostridium sp.]
MKKELLRSLPKMDKLLEEEYIKTSIDRFGRENIVKELRKIIENFRKAILNDEIHKEIKINEVFKILDIKLKENYTGSFQNVVNGTGVIIHTNLGRSLLSKKAIDNIIKVSTNYNNLEYDVDSGKRGSRYNHIEKLLTHLTGAEGALVVNNNAAAVLLVLSEIAKGKESIVSRGELVEIGGSFRIPDVMEMSGSKLKEVGTTNRTHLFDYEKAISEETGALVKIHSSNFKIIGYTSEVSSKEIAKLGENYNIPTIEDLGSGALVNLERFRISEKTVESVVKDGIDIITFSGDKLLGGPQAGIIVGKKEYIERIKKNQLLRALRVDKFTLAALEGTLLDYLNEENAYKHIPTLNMINKDILELEHKGKEFINRLKKASSKLKIELIKDEDYVGGGTLPTYILDGLSLEFKSEFLTANDLDKIFRANEYPIVGRIKNDRYRLSLRTLKLEDIDIIEELIKKL